jgi:hypothetical protein
MSSRHANIFVLARMRLLILYEGDVDMIAQQPELRPALKVLPISSGCANQELAMVAIFERGDIPGREQGGERKLAKKVGEGPTPISHEKIKRWQL